MTGLAKWLSALFTSIIPAATTSIGTSSAVTASGRASVNHSIAMNVSIASPLSVFSSAGRKEYIPRDRSPLTSMMRLVRMTMNVDGEGLTYLPVR